jgi:uncharacterized membrane protein
MGKGRLEAFSDGVIAILITIMVLELKVPHGGAWSDLAPLAPVILSYVLSFVYLGIYWNNHHHMLHAVRHVNGPILWANLHLLFWLSLVPFTTAWMGENHFAPNTVAAYGATLLGAGISYFVLSRLLIRHHGQDSVLAVAVGSDLKGQLSVVLYVAAIVASFWSTTVSLVVYGAVAVMWLIPDRRIERALTVRGDS